MAVTSLTATPRKNNYSPLEEVIVDVVHEGVPGSGDGGILVLQVFRDLGLGPGGGDVLVYSVEESFTLVAKDERKTSVVIDLRDRAIRQSFIQTTENGKFVIRGILARFYVAVHVKDDPSVKDEDVKKNRIDIVPVSAYEFRTSYLPERLLYQARLTRMDLSPAEISTDLARVLKNALEDNELKRVLRRAESYISSKLDSAIRPRKLISRPDTDDAFKSLYEAGRLNMLAVPPGYDEIIKTFSYNRTDANFFATRRLPRRPVLSVDRVRALYNNQVVYEFPRAWFNFDRFGSLHLIPTSGADVVQFLNRFPSYTPSLLTARDRLPGYWAIDWTYGMAGNEDEFDEALQLISYVAAEEVLTLLGSADKPGIASESRNTGGSSESISYTQSAVYSLFSADVDFIKKQLPRRIASLRERIHGPDFMVV